MWMSRKMQMPTDTKGAMAITASTKNKYKPGTDSVTGAAALGKQTHNEKKILLPTEWRCIYHCALYLAGQHLRENLI